MGINERQANLFLSGNPEWQKRIKQAGGAKPAAGAPRPKRNKEDLPENIVERQIKTFLESRGWIVTRNHVGAFVPIGRLLAQRSKGPHLDTETLYKLGVVQIGQKGAADFKAERPLRGVEVFGAVQQFYWEAKAPGGVPKPHQIDWMRIRASLGFSAAWFDRFEDQPAGKGQPFLPWYHKRFKD